MAWDPATATSAMRSIEAAFLIGVEGATEVWLIRHGDCYGNLGTSADGEGGDPPLSPAGQDQVRRLGERMRTVRVDAVYTSPLRRARETARALTGDVIVEPRLAEVAVDTSTGRVVVVEPPEEVVSRMSAAVDEAVMRTPGGRVVMVGHGVAILMFLCDVLRLEYGQLRVLPYYTSVNVVRFLRERRMVGSLGDVAHLFG